MIHPGIGTWLGEDGEVGIPDPNNLYRYCGNNPTNLTDPTGLYGEKVGENTGAKEKIGSISPPPAHCPIPQDVLQQYQKLYAGLTLHKGPGSPMVDYFGKQMEADKHYPPMFRKVGITAVALISDYTSGTDGFLWIKEEHRYYNVASLKQMENVLGSPKYPDNSIDLLVLSGHGLNFTCGIGFKVGQVDRNTITPGLLTMIRRKVKADGIVVIAGCQAGEQPDVQELATTLNRTVAAPRGTCCGMRTEYREWGLGGWAVGGYNIQHPKP